MTSCKLSCWTNSSCFCRERAFVRPSVIICSDVIHSIHTCPACTSWWSQWLWISTCLSDVFKWLPVLLSRRIVCWLSHRIVIMLFPSRTRSREVNNRYHHMNSDTALETVVSSASIDDFVMWFCLLAFQSTGPPNSFRMYPCMLRHVLESSAKLASLALTSIWSVSIVRPS
jgi:hypothetical protein